MSQFSNEPWLKFSYLGKTEFVAKKPLRHSISWDNISAVNAVFGNRTIKIGEHTYKIRILQGKPEGSYSNQSFASENINEGPEWNRLMLPIHIKAPSNRKFPYHVNSPTENWNVGYTDNDLLTVSSAGNGSYSWCQEYDGSTGYGLLRGYHDVSCFGTNSSSVDYISYGWRPVLELVD